ncbi:unnamed protein product [Schistocephalus solidus]|uniref:SLAIN motif family member 2 n=1 Tax=Schistocephalus solidus TaxID=70667 RepID=A0A183SUX1_SCHSO|nr:unnamed protein product [Schistocephalus solidus]
MMSRSLYENIPNKKNMNELQRELKGKYVPRGSADAIPPTPLCKSRLQIFGPERTSRLSLAMKMSGGLGDQISTEQAVARNSSPALTTATLSPSTSSRLRPASIVKPYRAVSPSLRTTGHQLHNRSPPVIRPRTIMPTHSITSGPQQADSQPSSPMRYVARLYSQNLLNLQPPRDNNADCPRDSSSDYDTASVSIKPPEVPTRTTASRRDVSPNVSQRKALSTPLPVLKLRDSHQCVPNIDNGPVSESDSSASLQDFSYEEHSRVRISGLLYFYTHVPHFLPGLPPPTSQTPSPPPLAPLICLQPSTYQGGSSCGGHRRRIPEIPRSSEARFRVAPSGQPPTPTIPTKPTNLSISNSNIERSRNNLIYQHPLPHCLVELGKKEIGLTCADTGKGH